MLERRVELEALVQRPIQRPRGMGGDLGAQRHQGVVLSVTNHPADDAGQIDRAQRNSREHRFQAGSTHDVEGSPELRPIRGPSVAAASAASVSTPSRSLLTGPRHDHRITFDRLEQGRAQRRRVALSGSSTGRTDVEPGPVLRSSGVHDQACRDPPLGTVSKAGRREPGHGPVARHGTEAGAGYPVPQSLVAEFVGGGDDAAGAVQGQSLDGLPGRSDHRSRAGG